MKWPWASLSCDTFLDQYSHGGCKASIVWPCCKYGVSSGKICPTDYRPAEPRQGRVLIGWLHSPHRPTRSSWSGPLPCHRADSWSLPDSWFFSGTYEYISPFFAMILFVFVFVFGFCFLFLIFKIQVKNHGIEESVIDGMLDMAKEFFHLPESERLKNYSDDPLKTMRLSTSFNVKTEHVSSWRDFLRLYCYPLEDYIQEWPSNPPSFRYN